MICGNVAVIGSGVAGLVAALRLAERGCQVHLWEANDYLGGHTHTVVPEEGVEVDTGFITFNDRTYPHFIQWLRDLGLEGRVSDMSFGYQDRLSGLAYGGHNLNTFFAQRRNVIHPDFLRLTLDIVRFNLFAARWVRRPSPLGTLHEFARRYSRLLWRHYLMPLGAAIWSAPPEGMRDFPAALYLRFFHNHGLLSPLDRPTWRTVPGGSHRYIQAFEKRFPGQISLRSPVERVRRHEERVELRVRGEWVSYDGVVLACHADQALRLLDDPDGAETAALSPWRYQENVAVLHTDTSVLPPLRRVRSSWNYVRESPARALLTYDMNRLQGLRSRHHYLVTLNPTRELAGTVGSWVYHHPHFTPAALATQTLLPGLQHRRRSYFCGSYFHYGFHEDAVVSALGA